MLIKSLNPFLYKLLFEITLYIYFFELKKSELEILTTAIYLVFIFCIEIREEIIVVIEK